MGCRNLAAVLAGLSLAAGCGQSPSSPSPAPATSIMAVQSTVTWAMAQTMSQAVLAAPATGGASNTYTVPCDGGGSIVMTGGNTLPPQQPNVFGASLRIEFRDCTHKTVTINGNPFTVTINGDPYLDTTITNSFSTPGGVDSVFTMQTTGGVRIDTNGVQGRVQFNCSMTSGSTPPESISFSGTTTIEQPLGSTPVVRPCGLV